jgi:hypothetical protein
VMSATAGVSVSVSVSVGVSAQVAKSSPSNRIALDRFALCLSVEAASRPRLHSIAPITLLERQGRTAADLNRSPKLSIAE